VLPNNAIEGATVDEKGTIYLVAEQDQTPGAYALVLAGLGLVGFSARRRRSRAN